MNGDLLRTLEAPDDCLKAKLIQASREGHCVIYYDNGHFCVFSVNGKLQATMETDDNIRVSMLKHCHMTQMCYIFMLEQQISERKMWNED